MFKKIAIGLSTFAVVAALPAATMGATQELSIRPIIYPPVRLINVTPGNPLELNSCGRLEVKGRGWARYEDFNGGVEISVKGKLAVKREDLGSVKILGFNHKHRRGNYIVYSGRGTASGSGQDLDLVVLGKAKIESKGCGNIHLKGRWEGTFQRFWVVYPEPEPIPFPLPVELSDLEVEALEN